MTHHYADACAERFDAVTKKWKKEKKVTAIGTDRAKNVVAVRQLPFKHILCAAQMLQRTITVCLDDSSFDTALSKCRKIVGHFKHSPASTEELHQQQTALGMPESPWFKTYPQGETIWRPLAHDKAEPCIGMHECPLEWWAAHTGAYGQLSSLAGKYLAAPAMSVPCERLFSLAGNIIQKKRAALHSDNVNKLVCLSNWLKETQSCLLSDPVTLAWGGFLI